jgi:hypothetical protein
MIFFVCSKCFRGQKYCSLPCKKIGYRLTQKNANRKHAASSEAKLDNRDRNREYRKRKKPIKNIVTENTSNQSPVSIDHDPDKFQLCIKCGAKVLLLMRDLNEYSNWQATNFCKTE